MGSTFRRRRRLVSAVVSLVLTGMITLGWNEKVAAQDISVMVDEAQLLRLNRPGAEVIIGNPSIADISVQNGQLLVITGKSFGMTNLIVLDGQGREILSRKVRVSTDRKRIVTLHKGKNRHTFDCQTRCEMTLMPGDTETHFEAVSKGVQAKFGIAQTALDGSQGAQ